MLWMTGGPGCSSEVALFGENGPCKVSTDGTSTTINPYSWNKNATMIYIDQPTGTGFSYGTGFDHDEVGVAADMYDFLQQFFKAHPQYQKNDFYVFGESYAGHYVPAVTHQVWKNNKALPAGAIKINLVGLAIGNGLTDPQEQYKHYPEMAASTNDHKAAIGRLGIAAMKLAAPVCTSAIAKCNANNTNACSSAMALCNLGLVSPYQATGLNPYDMRIKCAKPPLCYDFSNVATYLEQPAVQKALGVTKKWKDCNMIVNEMFQGDWMHNYQTQIPEQLADGIRVLIYAGDQDYICNWIGNKAWTVAMEWPHKADFNAATDEPWMAGGSKEAGKLRSANGFSFLQVYDAGHMVPLDQPENALAMANAFMRNKL